MPASISRITVTCNYLYQATFINSFSGIFKQINQNLFNQNRVSDHFIQSALQVKLGDNFTWFELHIT